MFLCGVITEVLWHTNIVEFQTSDGKKYRCYMTPKYVHTPAEGKIISVPADECWEV